MHGEIAVTNNTNNTNNSSNTNNVSNLGSFSDRGATYIFQDRVNEPFVDAIRKDVADLIPAQELINLPRQQKYWGAIWHAWRGLTEYAKLNWDGLDIQPPVLTKEEVEKEINKLVKLAEFERADALAEIIAQNDEFLSYFMGLLGATPDSHPQTHRLLHMANLFATFTAMHYKDKFNRQRPSEIYPMLLPPFVVPGHASYPSGHATQAHLMALCSWDLLPEQTLWQKDRRAKMKEKLEALATRIAYNREIAGVHYSSDSEAGKALAQEIHKAILTKNLNQLDHYKNTLNNARKEWEL
jgi:hypothetical protein